MTSMSIRDDDVGPKPYGRVDQLLAVANRTDDIEIRLSQDSRQALGDNRVIVSEENGLSATHATSWRNGTNAPWRARFCAIRVTPAHDWRERRLAPPVWLLCERDLGSEPRPKYYLVHLPATASLRQLVQLAHQRWAIDQQYQELKGEFGLDHFEGRSPRLGKACRADRPRLGLAAARTRTSRCTPADVAGGPRRHHRDSHGAFLRDASAPFGHHAETQGDSATDRTK